MRNPWRDFTYKGNWKRDDKKWTKELKQQLVTEFDRFGTFYIDLDTFIKEFDSITISHFHESWMTSYIQGVQDNDVESEEVPVLSFNFTIEEPSPLYVVLDTFPHRMYPERCVEGEGHVVLKLESNTEEVSQS
jgi:hypothetical protein